jgi:3-dehydroquinate synthetase
LGAAHGVTPEHVVARQAALLERYGLPNAYAGVEPEAAWEAMGRDKKAAAGRLSWVLLEEVGRAGVYRDVPADLAERTLRELRA